MTYPRRCSFGLGYKLTLVKAGEAFDQDRLTDTVINHVPTAQPLSCAGGEISFRLPREKSAKFPGLFRELETERTAMGVGGYGMSVTSLEEVFLSLEKEGSGGRGAEVGEGRGVNEPIGCSKHACVDMRDADGVRAEKVLQRRDAEGSSERAFANGSSVNGSGEGYSKGSTNGSTVSASAWRSEVMAGELCEIELQSMPTATAAASRAGSQGKRGNGHRRGKGKRVVRFARTHAGHNVRSDDMSGEYVRGSGVLAEEERATLLAEGQEDGHGFAFDGEV